MSRQSYLFSNDNNGDTFTFICQTLGCENNTPGWPDRFGECVTAYLSSKNEPSIRTLSLFSGAGGLDIGFNDIGFDIVESVEIEEKFCETLKLNAGSGKRFHSSKVNCIDIREYAGNIGHIDFIIGGPPCQTFSAAGRRANGVLGTSDARGVLFKEYIRLLQKLSPKGFLFENVYGITGAQNGKPWKEILDGFSSIGYHLFYRIVDAADYGVPQHRERLIIVGLKEGVFEFPRPTHGPDSIDCAPFYNASTAIEGLSLSEEEQKTGIGGRFGPLLNDIPPGLNYSFYTEEMGHPNPIFAWRSKFSDYLYKADPETPVRTIKASGGAYTGPFHWLNRVFSYSEFKRLQTFPDNYEISGSKAIAVKQIGNSVPPQMARMMAIAIRQQLFGTSFPFTLPLLREDDVLTFRKRKHFLTDIYRRKAQIAISSIKKDDTSHPVSREYYCTLSNNFEFTETLKGDGMYRIKVVWGDALRIDVSQIGHSRLSMGTIMIKSNDTSWGLRVNQVYISIKAENIMGFTVAWKAFEQELIVNSIKADLVQLNGYYQYNPKLLCRCRIKNTFPHHHILEQIVAGEEIAEIISTNDLAKAWEVPSDSIIEIAEFLRKIGYEIRNHNTNPQIDEQHWLIPYAFPTLTPQSVQLGKKVN